VLRQSREIMIHIAAQTKPPALTHPESVLAAFFALRNAFCFL
jgi:hypothetical protein